VGGRAAAAGCLDGFGERVPWAACDTQAARLLATGLERKLHLDVPRTFRPEFIGRSLEAQREPLARLLRKKELVVLFGALDEPVTLPLCAALGGHMRTEKHRVCTIGLEPLLPSTRSERGGLNGSDLFLRVAAAFRTEAFRSDTTAARFARLGEETLSFAVQALLAALVGCESAPGFSFDELREFLRGGVIPSTVAASQGPEAVLAAFEQVMSVGCAKENCGAAVAMAAGREFSWSEVRTIRSRMAETFDSEMPSPVGFGTDPALGDDVRCLLMCRPRASRNVVPLR